MKIWAVGFAVVLLAGCATAPTPLPFNGNYYMVGDSSCVRVRELTPTRAMCIDKNDNETGYRDALSPAQLQAYQIQLAERQRNAELNRQWTNQQAQQPLPAYYPSYGTPQVQGIPAQGTTSYNQVGNTLIGTDGTSCQTVGQTTICR